MAYADSMYTLHSIAGNEQHPVLSYVFSTLGVGALVAYLSYARSLNSARALYLTWISVATYIAWLGCTIYAHANGLLDEGREGWMGSGSIWQGLGTSKFSFFQQPALTSDRSDNSFCFWIIVHSTPLFLPQERYDTRSSDWKITALAFIPDTVFLLCRVCRASNPAICNICCISKQICNSKFVFLT